jgi:hypothetical protein
MTLHVTMLECLTSSWSLLQRVHERNARAAIVEQIAILHRKLYIISHSTGNPSPPPATS